MTLEVLFSQAAQGRTFLLLALFGALLALAVHTGSLLHRLHRWLGIAADLLCAVLAAVVLGRILLASGSGLRLYGLLGLMIGAALYSAGPGPAVIHLLEGLIRRRRIPSEQE